MQQEKDAQAAAGDSKEWDKKMIELSTQNNKLQKMNRGATEKIKQLVEQNYRLENKLPIYIPKKYDKIDLALATFLNFHYPEREKMKILFLRESEGVYTFGSKRIYLKID